MFLCNFFSCTIFNWQLANHISPLPWECNLTCSSSSSASCLPITNNKIDWVFCHPSETDHSYQIVLTQSSVQRWRVNKSVMLFVTTKYSATNLNLSHHLDKANQSHYFPSSHPKGLGMTCNNLYELTVLAVCAGCLWWRVSGVIEPSRLGVFLVLLNSL
jgi:hypothetical protein